MLFLRAWDGLLFFKYTTHKIASPQTSSSYFWKITWNYHIQECLVHPFGHTILLWIVWNSGLMLNPMLGKINIKFIRSIFLSIISMKSANTRLCFIFNPYMKFFKCLRFTFQQINPTHPGVIINKFHDIFITINIWNMHGAAKIRVYQL